MFDKGDFVILDGRIGVVTTLGPEIPGDAEDHSGVWFGEMQDGAPIVWVIPTEYLARVEHGAVFRH
jgi:hypothetical protein